MLLHVATGMLHAGRRQHQLALEEFAAAAQAQSLLSGVHALVPRITGWLATTQARLGMPDEARTSLEALTAERDRTADGCTARAVIAITEGEPSTALDVLRDVLDGTTPNVPVFKLVEAQLLAGTAQLDLGNRNAAAVAVEAALAAAEPDRLIFPFAMTASAELLDALPRHETTHGALLADIVDVLVGSAPTSTDRNRSPQVDDLSPSELLRSGFSRRI